MSKKRDTIKLWQDEEGKWCATSPEFCGSAWSVGDTPDEAVEKHKRSLADFRQMVSHIDGECHGLPDCRWCKEHPEMKGLRTRKKKTSA